MSCEQERTQEGTSLILKMLPELHAVHEELDVQDTQLRRQGLHSARTLKDRFASTLKVEEGQELTQVVLTAEFVVEIVCLNM